MKKWSIKHRIYRKFVPKIVCANAQKEGKHRLRLHKAQKYGIISTEKRNIAERCRIV